MSKSSTSMPNQRGPRVGRRRFLRSLGAAGAALGAAGAMGPWVRASAQQAVTIRAMTLQSSPLQLKAYEAMVKSFEAAHPNIKVKIEPIAETVLWPKLSAAYAGGDVPDLVLQMVSPSVISLFASGLVLPVNDVLDKVGKSDFQQNALDIYNDKGTQFAITYANNSNMLWYRKDMLEEEGLSVPTYWDELAQVAKKLTKKGKYGTSLPYGKTAMTNSITWTLVYQAGGRVIAPDGSVVFDSPETVAAFEFWKEMFQYAPPGATRYDWADTLNAFVTGAAATTMYTGRALINTNNQNPAIADKISCAPYPYRREGKPWWVCPFEAILMPKGAKNIPEAKLFAAWNYEKASYIQLLHATPGHQIPVLKSVAASPEYNDHPLLKKYDKEVKTMVDTIGKAHSVAKPHDDSPYLLKAGDIQGSGVFAETIQKIVVEKEPARSAVTWAQDRIAKIVKG